MKEMKERNKAIDQDIDQLQGGVQRLRDIAIDMGNVYYTINQFNKDYLGTRQTRC